MSKHEKIVSRCPFGDRIISFIISIILVFNITNCAPVMAAIVPSEQTNCVSVKAVESSNEPANYDQVIPSASTEPAPESTSEPEPILKSNEEIISEINAGLWGNGDERKNRLIEAGYDYDEIQSKINTIYISESKTVPVYAYTGSGLTKSGGVYWNPNTGLKETWYSQRVLPGGGLDIPGRHVNDEGFVCDGDGYICVSSSTYSKGTIIETSRGVGKVYDSGCAPGVLDIYVDW